MLRLTRRDLKSPSFYQSQTAPQRLSIGRVSRIERHWEVSVRGRRFESCRPGHISGRSSAEEHSAFRITRRLKRHRGCEVAAYGDAGGKAIPPASFLKCDA